MKRLNKKMILLPAVIAVAATAIFALTPVMTLFPATESAATAVDKPLQTAFAECGATLTGVTLRNWSLLAEGPADEVSLLEMYGQIRAALGDDEGLTLEQYDDDGFFSLAIRGQMANGADLEMTLQSLENGRAEPETYLIAEARYSGGDADISALYGDVAAVFRAVGGDFDPALVLEGRFEELRSKAEKRRLAKAAFAAVEGKVEERVSDGGYLSYSGYVKALGDGVASGDHRVNMQVALSDGEAEGVTRVYVGTPVVFSDF